MPRSCSYYIFLLAGILLSFSLPAQPGLAEADSALTSQINAHVQDWLNSDWIVRQTGYQKKDSTRIDSVRLDLRRNRVLIFADKQLAFAPVREEILDSLKRVLGTRLGEEYKKYRVELYSGGRMMEDYIPNFYRSRQGEKDNLRARGRFKRKSRPLVQDLSRSFTTNSSLYRINIALWHSHGWYYEPSLHRWEWQRARIFQTVEDIYPMAYTLQMLVPMLENAGATVLLPRERDWQTHEVIVDNNGSTGFSLCKHAGRVSGSSSGPGFGIGHPPYVDENPFRLGTYEELTGNRISTDSVQWIPEIPESGEYAVYVSYNASDQNSDGAQYAVYHAGGVTRFAVNQQMGGGTWVYLGRFHFRKGIHQRQGKVVLTNESRQKGSRITADAVRFGGGMGNIARKGLTGKRPRYQEAARYYLQYAGFPDTLVWKLNTPANDYNDDYQSRGEWVNYLVGAPSGPTVNRDAAGLGIPVDLSLAFHTDAGISHSDTVIGTLGIYSTSHDDGYFPDGLSRMASRDLTDIIQTAIVEDIRAVYDGEWIRRGMWDRGYSEAFRPNVPAMLLELSSHQNLIDMRFGQEPMFRFLVSRAIYKGMLRYLNSLYGIEYVVQPLPVTHFRTFIPREGEVTLEWKPRTDPLEPTAEPDHYLVYTRINDGGFDNGRMITEPTITLGKIHPDSIYSFKVTALNGGGESFPSEVLSVCETSGSGGTILIINAFDRVGGAAFFSDEKYAGFLPMVDQGVPYEVDLHTVGAQYDYIKSSPWLDDDSPGHGASYADLEQKVIPGNSFDFSYVHGTAIARAGYSFVSVSDESAEEGGIDLSGYRMIDFIAGEERTSFMPKNDSLPRYQIFPAKMTGLLKEYLDNGGNLLISGAHIATDVHLQDQDSLVAGLFKYRWRTSNASRLGEFYFMDPHFGNMNEKFSFNAGYHNKLYTVEGADALEPADSTAITLIRYNENNMSGGVAYRNAYGIVALGFPFETIMGEDARDLIMQRTISYLLKPEKDD